MAQIIRASCGCLVIPLHAQEGKMLPCILLKACDSSEGDGWTFTTRQMEVHKVFVDSAVDYSRLDKTPAPLNDDESQQAIRQIGKLVHLGLRFQDVAHAISAASA